MDVSIEGSKTITEHWKPMKRLEYCPRKAQTLKTCFINGAKAYESWSCRVTWLESRARFAAEYSEYVSGRLTGETSLATVYRLETIGNPRFTTSAPLWIGSKPQRATSYSAFHRLEAHRFSTEYSEYGLGEAHRGGTIQWTYCHRLQNSSFYQWRIGCHSSQLWCGLPTEFSGSYTIWGSPLSKWSY